MTLVGEDIRVGVDHGRAGCLVLQRAEPDRDPDDPEPWVRDAGWVRAIGLPWLTFVEPTMIGHLVERRVLHPRQVEAQAGRLGRRQERVEIRIEADVDVDDRRGALGVAVDQQPRAPENARQLSTWQRTLRRREPLCGVTAGARSTPTTSAPPTGSRSSCRAITNTSRHS